jgi:hypothetical protein
MVISLLRVVVVPFYDFDINFLNCSARVIFFVFDFIGFEINLDAFKAIDLGPMHSQTE